MKSQIRLCGNTLFYGKLRLDFPAVRLSINGKIISPVGEGRKYSSCGREYQVDGITLKVEVFLKDNVLHKKVFIRSNRLLPTPDFVELDRQRIPDLLTLRGYISNTHARQNTVSSEESHGKVPGCGYPVAGKNFFAGVEHPAAFARIEEKGNAETLYTLTQHPVWQSDNSLVLSDAVLSWSADAEEALRQYINTIRIPALKKPFFTLCTFWTDRFLDDFEYVTSPEGYRSFAAAWEKFGITPDVFVLDAGWQDLNSLFEPRKSFGGREGIRKLERFVRRLGSRLGLWVSYNGPAGFHPEFLKKSGFEVGGGNGAAYSGEGMYGVLLDEKFANAISESFAGYARSGIAQFKIDWDNEGAVNDNFKERYPTADHVREGSIDAMIRIIKKMRQARPDLVLRTGWWPSPWWLKYTNHFFLTNSGDSEYSFLPARTQRDSAITYRDTVYWCFFQRDKSCLPLDTVDNHEFPHAFRNPVHEEPGTFTDNALWSVMRGTSYQPWTLQPEALEEVHLSALRQVMAFARSSGKNLYNVRSGMCGGNPHAGEVYGFYFIQPDKSVWYALRNPSVMPRRFKFAKVQPNALQIYPSFARLDPEEEILFAPHEIKIISLAQKKFSLPYNVPFQAWKQPDGKILCHVPAHLGTGRMVVLENEIHRIKSLCAEVCLCEQKEDVLQLRVHLILPQRMRKSCLTVAVRNVPGKKADITARCSRFSSPTYGACQQAVTRYDNGHPGMGLKVNQDCLVPVEESYWSVPCAEGGESWCSLFITGARSGDVRLAFSGYYAPSRKGETLKRACAALPEILPPVHPDGFPVAEIISVPEEK
ncbi:MAG: hypothetical protein IKA32_11765 [Lentisphaeria bacterium]|nr:hypothetical protein [Lentisphaeria bacterium]